MNKNIKEVASLQKQGFIIKTKENGNDVITVCNSNIYLKNFIHKVHKDNLPDDFIYKTIYNCIESVANGNFEISSILEDVTADIHTHDLIRWASSNFDRTSYIDDILSEYMIEDFNELLQLAQSKEINEICYATLQFLEDRINNKYFYFHIT